MTEVVSCLFETYVKIHVAQKIFSNMASDWSVTVLSVNKVWKFFWSNMDINTNMFR